MTMTLIETKTLGTAVATVVFSSIPQDGTDLYAFVSARNTVDAAAGTIAFNTGGTYTRRRLLGSGSGSGASDTPTNDYLIDTSTQTANTFGNSSVYIPNYTGSTTKSYSVDAVDENNATGADQALYAGLWNQTAAITSITFAPVGGGSFVAGTIISLYKITKGSDGIVTTSP
jgi:hypothetical protein